MRITLCELKKIMYYQKGLFYIILFFIVSVALLIVNDCAYNNKIEIYKDEYNYYMDVIKGKMNEKKVKYLENEADKIARANFDLTQLYNQYYSGEVSKMEFEKQENILNDIVENQNGFEEIFKDYLYVSENAENRYFLYSNGWNGLLSNENLEIILFIIILLLVTNVFCYEYKNEMDVIALTSKKGSISYTFIKVLLTLLIVFIICVFSFAIKYFFYEMKYGLPNGNYPIQSIYLFRESTKNITLIKTFLYMHIMKLFGYLFFSVVILFISINVKKYLTTVFLSTGLILIPYIGLRELYIYYFQPLGLILGVGYFKGIEYERNVYDDEKTVIFNEFSQQSIILIIAISTLVILFMFYILYIKNENKWNLKNSLIFKRIKKTKVTLFALALIVLSGCKASNFEENNIIYNFNERLKYENDKYYIDFKDNESEFVFLNKKTNNKEKLIRNPLDKYVDYETCLFGNEDYVYYAKRDLEYTPVLKEKTLLRGSSSMYNFSIIEINTNTFDEKVIFEKNIGKHRGGILKRDDRKWNFLRSIGGFFLDSNNIYIIDSDGVRIINRKTSSTKLIVDIPMNHNIAFNGRYIYYIGDRFILSRYDIINETHTQVDDVITEDFTLYKDRIEFFNKLDNDNLYYYDINTGELRKK